MLRLLTLDLGALVVVGHITLVQLREAPERQAKAIMEVLGFCLAQAILRAVAAGEPVQ